jgi:hypothetical protein
LPLVTIALALVAAWPVAAADEKTEKKPLSIGVTGSTPSERTKNPTAILGSARIQRMILEISDTPKSRPEIEAIIAGEFFTLDDMVNVGLLREENDLYRIDFNLLRVADQKLILKVSEQLGRDLAAAFLARRGEFEALAVAHEQPHVDKADLFFVVLGCFSLDWDGLDLTEERGYRAGAQRTIDGHGFTPWAKEKGMALSLKGLYWGSHSSNRSFTHTTFGDHDALPRFGLPDMMWNSGGAFQRYEHIEEGRRAAGRLLSIYMADAMEDVASVMVALSKQDLALAPLAARTGIDTDKLERILALLEAADYVSRQQDAYAGRVLVLGARDQAMVRGMVAKGREIMIAWHETNYAGIKGALSALTPLENGVPFERVYTEVWHFVFGIANRELVKAGFFADPYAEDRRHKGFLPFIWASDLDVSAP